MLIGIETSEAVKRLGEEKAFELIKKAGFDCVDVSLFDPICLGDNYLENAQHTKHLLEKYGLVCNQAHAPFREFKYGDNMDPSCQSYREILRSMEYAALIGAKHIAMHGVRVPGPFGPDVTDENYRLYSCFGTEEALEYNYCFFKSLAPYAKELGLRIAIENVGVAFSIPRLMNEIIKYLDDPVFVVLVDVGHSLLFRTSPEVFISSVSPGLIHGLHIQDNDGITDQHLIPGLGKVAWDNVLTALANCGYEGDFTLEIPAFIEAMPMDATYEALALSAKIARGMVKRMDEIRQRKHIVTTKDK